MAANWAGFETVGFAEIAPYQSELLAKRWPDIPNYGNVKLLCPDEQTELTDKDVTADAILRQHGRIDLLTAGVPCQPASQAGKRLGTNDERWLWPDALRVLRQLRPQFAVFENPKGIKTVEDGQSFREIQAELASSGYDYWWDSIPATAVGGGHVRERVWLVAYSHSAGLEGHSGLGVPPEGWSDKRRPSADADLSPRKTSNRETWYRESPVCPVVDGVSASSFRSEFEAIGNAIVPQVAYCLLKPIADLIVFREQN